MRCRPLLITLLFLPVLIAAAPPQDLHLHLQTVDATGQIEAGTFTFVFNITSDAACANVLYSDNDVQTTDARGIVSYYLENVSLAFNDTYYLCYYRDGILKSASKLAQVPYSYYASNVSWSNIQNMPAGFADGSDADSWNTSDDFLLVINQSALNLSNSFAYPETDSAHDSCAEIAGCVVGAITDGNDGWDNSYNFLTNDTMNKTATGLTCTDCLDTTQIQDIYVSKSGDSITGSLVINGNLTVIGDVLNATVTDIFMNGSQLPSIAGMFDIGSAALYWQSVYAQYIHATLFNGSMHCSNLTGATYNVCANPDTFNTTQEFRDACNNTAMNASLYVNYSWLNLASVPAGLWDGVDNEGTDSNAGTICDGTTTYLDGEGNCDDISGVYWDDCPDAAYCGFLAAEDDPQVDNLIMTKWCRADALGTAIDCDVEPVVDTTNSTLEMRVAVNNSNLNLSNSTDLPCSSIMFDTGLGSASICDGVDGGGAASSVNSSYQCSGTDKLYNVSIIDGNITGVCATDQTGSSATSAASTESWSVSQEFLTTSASVFDPFLGTALSSGTIATVAGDILHPGVIGLRDSTTANGGYMVRTDASAFLISGGEKATFIFRQNTARNETVYRLGFFDAATVTEATDGCYFYVNQTVTGNNNLSARCRSNNAETRSSTDILIANLVWYTGIMEVSPTAGSINFSLYNQLLGTLVWNTTITTNIPTAAGRETGFGAIATQNTTDAAADIVQLDYMRLQLMNRSTVIRQAFTSNATIRLSQEFLTASASVFDPFLGTAISSGTATANGGSANHPGVVNLSDSTTAQGGYRIMTDVGAFLISGNESASFVFRHPNNDRGNASYRLGFQDSTAINTLPTDGCWLNVSYYALNNRTVFGVCSSNSVRSQTANYTLSLGSWYTGRIMVNAAASSVNFSVTTDAGVMVWNATVTTNIPTAAGRETGFGVIAGEATTSAAAPIVSMDYMDLVFERSIIR